MFDRYKKIISIFLFLLYISILIYIIFYSNSIFNYAIALFIVSLGFGLHFIFENKDNSRIRKFLFKFRNLN